MLPTYVLVTPARNEADLIELTLKSMVGQRVLPAKWVIVSDGSTDGTDEIVSRYAAAHPWIELVRMPERKERHFSGKVYAFHAGYARLKDVAYDVIGSLDGDLSFDEHYFEFLLEKLQDNPKLGLVGTPFQESTTQVYDYRFVNIEHVSGACQLFRRQCYEDIGGYVPVKGGGIDYIAVTTARMKGWQTRTFTEKVCHHHRPMGTAHNKFLPASFKMGVKDYVFGNHPLWEMFRSAYQLTRKPRIVGGVFLICGYVSAMARRLERPVSNDFIHFVRQEQMHRLFRFFGHRGRASTQTISLPPEQA